MGTSSYARLTESGKKYTDYHQYSYHGCGPANIWIDESDDEGDFDDEPESEVEMDENTLDKVLIEAELVVSNENELLEQQRKKLEQMEVVSAPFIRESSSPETNKFTIAGMTSESTGIIAVEQQAELISDVSSYSYKSIIVLALNRRGSGLSW